MGGYRRQWERGTSREGPAEWGDAGDSGEVQADGSHLFNFQVDAVQCPLQARAPCMDLLAFFLFRTGPLITIQKEVSFLLCQHRLVLSVLQLPRLLFLAPGSPLVFFHFGGQLGRVLNTGVGGVPCQGGIFHLYLDVRTGRFVRYHVNLFH